jgi:hypothetical protein
VTPHPPLLSTHAKRMNFPAQLCTAFAIIYIYCFVKLRPYGSFHCGHGIRNPTDLAAFFCILTQTWLLQVVGVTHKEEDT